MLQHITTAITVLKGAAEIVSAAKEVKREYDKARKAVEDYKSPKPTKKGIRVDGMSSNEVEHMIAHYYDEPTKAGKKKKKKK